jgi:hypothetical protein
MIAVLSKIFVSRISSEEEARGEDLPLINDTLKLGSK